MADDTEMLHVPADAAARLATLKARPKFRAEDGGLYTGIRDGAERAGAEAVVNAMIGRVERRIADRPTKQGVLQEFEIGLSQLTHLDTEDRERAADYVEEIMDCIGLESSDGLLNRWMYGFDPT